MKQAIRFPRNQTALMQLIQRLVGSGHFYWCSDQIPYECLARFIEKWRDYQLRADAPARAYRKSVGRASVQLCLCPESTMDENKPQPWWMLSTVGKLGLADEARKPARVWDARTEAGRLRLREYELLLQTKVVNSAGKSKSMMTWTWRLTPQRYKEWEALLVTRAKARDRQGVEEALACLRAMPMFSGVRFQVIRLIGEANRMLRKVGLPVIEVPKLPIMRMIELWGERGV